MYMTVKEQWQGIGFQMPDTMPVIVHIGLKLCYFINALELLLT